jgi:hypothetical protein
MVDIHVFRRKNVGDNIKLTQVKSCAVCAEVPLMQPIDLSFER